MPRPEGYASMQFDSVESSGKQVMVQCRHCQNKKLARSVASRKVKHLQRCVEFHRHLAELAHTGNDELNDVPPELLNGPQKKPPGQPKHPQRTPRRTEDPLPALLDGLGFGRQTESSDPSLDQTREWNRTPGGGGGGGDGEGARPTESLPESVVGRPVRLSTNVQEPVSERQVASAHRAAQRRRERLDAAITRAVYEGSLPFNVFDGLKHPALADFFRLVDYTPPSRQRVADDLYDRSYDQVRDDRIIPHAS